MPRLATRTVFVIDLQSLTMTNNSPFVQSGAGIGDEISTLEMKYGESQIAEGHLITFPNPRVGRRYDIHITLPEFTCKCPFSGYPDFATIGIIYVPDQKVVELKALKLYINSFRDRYISHEEVTNQILDDFVAIADPHQITVRADFSPRGNVHMIVEVKHEK